jgi:hypothetical protein
MVTRATVNIAREATRDAKQRFDSEKADFAGSLVRKVWTHNRGLLRASHAIL